jgi:hypothetical protein
LFFVVVLFTIGAALSRRANVSISLAAGAVAYGVAAFGLGVLAAAFNTSMACVLTSLIFATALGFLLKDQKARIASGLSALGARAVAFAIPAAIGLLPMPGGAYISAVVVDPLCDKMWLKSRQKTFLNYWMRHIWIPVWPLFQGVLITAVVLGVSV